MNTRASVVVGAALGIAGCFGCREDPWVVEVSVERGKTPVPDRVELEASELAAPGGALLATTITSVAGMDFFADKGSSNRYRMEPTAEAGALRVRATSLDAAGLPLASGLVEVPRQEGTAFVTLVLSAGEPGDGGTDSGMDGGTPDGGDAGAACGDGVRKAAEACDGSDLGGEDCTTIGQGWVGGALGCTPACSFDTSGCVAPPGCGDGVIGGAEQCDGSDLGGASCSSLGFDGGTLSCAGGCVLDTASCTDCGDGVVEGLEVCDGANLAGQSCLTLGHDGGALACTADCLGVDSGACTDCGDGVIEGAENCEGADLGGSTCTSLGYTGGTLACGSTCAFDVGACTGAPPAPIPRKPMNNRYLGSIFVAGSLRPTFVWEPVPGAGITYELQYATDATFASGLTTVMTSVISHQPAADLPVATTPPVGARFWWRVRACDGALCSSYSSAWYVNVGRSIRDFNGDGYADLAVSAYEADGTGGVDSGTVSIFLGGPGPIDLTADLVLSGPAPDGQFGAWIDTLDHNGDGFSDLIVGSNTSDAAGTDSGAAFFYFGGSPLDGSPDGTLIGAAADDAMGERVASAGDVNGDGYDDLLVASPLSDLASFNAGRVNLYHGGPGTFDGTAELILTGEAAMDGLGTSLAGGDVNGDGFSDLAVGTPYQDSGGENTGRVYVYFGSALGADAAADWILTGSTLEGYGNVLAARGDYDDDGFSDLLIGSASSDVVATDAGRALAFRGGSGSTFDTVADVFFAGSVAGEMLGKLVAWAGDLNADEIDDMAVARSDGVRVYFGVSGGMDAVADGDLIGISGEGFGWSVAGAGDVDGDGVGDLIVGAIFNGLGGAGAGAAYVFRGASGSSFDASADASLYGLAGDSFGAAVARLLVAPPMRSGGRRI